MKGDTHHVNSRLQQARPSEWLLCTPAAFFQLVPAAFIRSCSCSEREQHVEHCGYRSFGLPSSHRYYRFWYRMEPGNEGRKKHQPCSYRCFRWYRYDGSFHHREHCAVLSIRNSFDSHLLPLILKNN